MLFQGMTVLAISASVMAHPYASRDRHNQRASRGGNVIAPAGGTYGTADGTSAYGLGETGLTSGISAIPTRSAAASSIDTAVAAASDDSACDVGSGSTTTIYSTDLVTLTVTAEDTVTIQTSSGMVSEIATGYAASDATATRIDETQNSSAVVSQSVTVLEESTIDVVSTAAAETSGAESYPSSASLTSSETILAVSASPSETTGSPASSSEFDEEPSVDAVSTAAAETSGAGSYPLSASLTSSEAILSASASPPETTGSPTSGSESDSSSSTMTTPGAFYEVSQSPSESSSSAAPVSSAAPWTGSPSAGKRGLAFNSAELTEAFAGTSMGWAYNWAANPSGTIVDGIEYVPMLWGEKAFDGWDAAAKSALASGSTHMLSFNEPDLSAQANMDSATAAAAHIKYMNPYADQARIGSPSITNGGPAGGSDGMGLAWMQKFFDNCDGKCKVDFLTFHWYDSADNFDYFKKHVQSVIDMAKKNGVSKVWLTEFAVTGSDEDVANFLGEALPWMDSNDAVERYAYFMCSEGHLTSGASMSDPVGKAYAV